MIAEQKIARQVAHLFDLLDLLRPNNDEDYERAAAVTAVGFAFIDRLRNAATEVASYRAALAHLFELLDVAEFESACEQSEREREPASRRARRLEIRSGDRRRRVAT
jgi:hypothetical protein